MKTFPRQLAILLGILELFAPPFAYARGPLIWAPGSAAKDISAGGITTPKLQVTETGGGTDTISVVTPSIASAWTFTLPTSGGTNNYALTTNGSGTSSWSQVSLTAGVTGVLPLANGGTNKNATASNGAVVYSDSDSFELSSVGTNGQALLSTGAGAPAFTWGNTSSGTADVTITTTDGFDTFILTSNARTFTLPAASSSANREITFINATASSEVMTITRAGSDTIGPEAETSIKLSFSGDTATLKSNGSTKWNFVGPYYQSATFSSTYKGNGSGSANSSSYDTIIVRVGNVVTLYQDEIVAVPSGTTNTIGSNSAFDGWARPKNGTVSGGTAVRNNGSYVSGSFGDIGITTGGVINCRRDPNLTAFTNAANAGCNSFTVSYPVNN